MVEGYVTTTYKMKLLCKRLDWLEETKDLYNRVRAFYHALLLSQTELHGLGSQAAMRGLEQLTIKSRTGDEPVCPIPWEGIPSYFRRAAINGSIGAFKTYEENHHRWEKAVSENSVSTLPKALRSEPQPAKSFCSAPVFYKGMYKNFTDTSIVLKLWTGKSWGWVKCTFRGNRALPSDSEPLSPRVVLKKNKAYLHIPIREKVSDTRPVKTRIVDGDGLCSVTFTNTDAFAVCSMLSADGRYTASRFVRGGKEYVHHSKRLLERIKTNRAVLGKHFDWRGCNKKYWEHLNQLSDYWAHKVSREIVRFCTAQGAKVIALPDGDPGKMELIAKRAGKYSPVYLSQRIRKYLIYKAWQAGIAVTYVRPRYTAAACSRCGSVVETVSKEMGRNYSCPQGHRGNRDLNTTRNIGRSCLVKLGKPSARSA